MLEAGTEVVVHLSGDPDKGPGLRGFVTDAAEGGCVIEIETELAGADAEPGPEALVSYHLGGVFVRRSAQVLEAERHAASLTLHLAGMEDPVAAEGRRLPRISMVASDASVTLEAEACPILDAGSGGLAVMSSERYAVGDVVNLVYEHGGRRLAARAAVRSVREVFESRYRYGLEWLEGGSEVSALLLPDPPA